MRKSLIIFIVASLALFVWAENKMQFHFSNGITRLFNLTEIDTIRFSGGNITLDGVGETFAVDDVDSATFVLEKMQGDTVFVVYNGDEATVINPLESEGVAVSTSGAEVAIVSTAQKKSVVYCLSGSSTSGSFNLTPDKGYTLVFDNLSLSNTNSPIVLNKGMNDTSYVATVHLRGESSIEDGSSNANNGAFYTKSKLKVSNDNDYTNGVLSITGATKHALNSSKRIELYSGSLVIEGAEGDGINADGIELYGGNLTVTGTKGDAVDCSEVIFIQDGTVDITTTEPDTKGLKCDSIINIYGGDTKIVVEGAGAKAVKSGKKTTVSGGVLTTELKGADAFYDETTQDYGYNAAIKSTTDIEITGTGKVIVTGNGIAARAINSDGNTTISGGELNVSLDGAHHLVESKDTTSLYGIKADGNVQFTGGETTITLGTEAKVSKGIKTARSLEVTGGILNVTTNGGYFTTTSTSTTTGSGSSSWGQSSWGGGRPGQSSSSSTSSSSDFKTAKAVAVDGTCNIIGGTITLVSAYGKGIGCDGTVNLGTKNGSTSDFTLNVTSGSDQCGTYTSGGFGGMGGGMGESRTKVNGKPKAIKADGAVYANSGKITLKAYDTGILSPIVEVNGGEMTVDAKYDQGLFGKETLTFNGGFVNVTASYEAFSGKVITFNEGSSTICHSSDDAWNATDGNESSSSVHIYVKGGVHYAVGAGDGLDSNGDMTISGGIVVVSQTGNGNSPLDTNDGWTHTGGFVLACGGSGMFSESVPSSSQGHIYNTSMSINANSYLIVANASGSVLAAFKVPQSAQAAVCAYNSEVTDYKFYVGSSYNGTLDYFDGVFNLYDTNRPTISTSNYTAYTVSTTNGNSGGGMGGRP